MGARQGNRRCLPVPRRSLGGVETHAIAPAEDTVATTRNPIGAKERADEIADLVSEACEKLIDLANEWFTLNDREGILHAHRMIGAKEVTLMMSARVAESGLSHIALNLLRTDIPMPRPFFEIQVPMLPWTLSLPEWPFEDMTASSPQPAKPKFPRS
jgi:hypothetical protein